MYFKEAKNTFLGQLTSEHIVSPAKRRPFRLGRVRACGGSILRDKQIHIKSMEMESQMKIFTWRLANSESFGVNKIDSFVGIVAHSSCLWVIGSPLSLVNK